MPRPRFSEVLVSRRRELGLSISQASKVLKLREDVLQAFEEGDYDHMPQSGYAQGMLSSYSRYLGLNAREVVDLFQEDLYEHTHGTSSHELRRRTRQNQSGHGVSGYDVVNEAESRPKAYVEYRPLLPTSGGPAGDMGYFATSSPVRARTSVPLAGVGPAALGTRGSYGTDSSHTSSTGHPYNTAPARERSQASTARRRAAGRRRRRRSSSDDRSSRLLSEAQYAPGRNEDESARTRTGRLYRRDDVSTRRVSAGEYTDDLRYDDRANPYAPASTISGRRSSRNIARVERPNVRRRSPSRDSRSSSSRGGRTQQQGLAGAVRSFFANPGRALFVIIVVLLVALMAILVLSVGSCVSGRTQTATTGQTVAVNNVGADDTADDDGSSADDDASTDADADADAAAADDDAEAADDEDEVAETVVEVSVASGEVSWLEVECDGESPIADTVTGPWSATYTVHDSITVQAANPSAVTVTENGEDVDFTSHASGMGSVTIAGTPAAEDAEAADDASADAADSTG